MLAVSFLLPACKNGSSHNSPPPFQGRRVRVGGYLLALHCKGAPCDRGNLLFHSFERAKNRTPFINSKRINPVLLKSNSDQNSRNPFTITTSIHQEFFVIARERPATAAISFFDCHFEQRFRASEESDAIGRLQESISGTARKYLQLKQREISLSPFHVTPPNVASRRFTGTRYALFHPFPPLKKLLDSPERV